ncbi:MAG: hypothetical protein IPK98_14155 [Chloracidobacterium sp.]|nr:hypothetical protein [Chloracidobacterium sp.]
MMTRKISRGVEESRSREVVGTLVLTFFIALTGACGANDGTLKSGKETPASSNAQLTKSVFEEDLGSMRTADFRFVYVLRRKDGGKIDAEDRSVIKAQTTDANRRMSSDDDKAFIIGTNTQIPPKNMFVLMARFAVENYSPPPVANTNANANK